MLRARERHVQKAQVFAQPVGVGQGELRVVVLQQHFAAAVLGGQIDKARALAFFFAKAAGKGQAYQRVLQALAFVDGDDLDQIGIALQTHDLRVALRRAVVDLGAQPAHQRVFALERAAGGLQ